jgi:hypothetical protein
MHLCLLPQVHELWALEGLTSFLLGCDRLPGGWSLVQQELLDREWVTLYELHEQDRALYEEAEARAFELLARAHATRLNGKKLVHGDLRGNNIMVSRTQTITYSNNLSTQEQDVDNGLPVESGRC